jgi:hypothetical protein
MLGEGEARKQLYDSQGIDDSLLNHPLFQRAWRRVIAFCTCIEGHGSIEDFLYGFVKNIWSAGADDYVPQSIFCLSNWQMVLDLYVRMQFNNEEAAHYPYFQLAASQLAARITTEDESEPDQVARRCSIVLEELIIQIIKIANLHHRGLAPEALMLSPPEADAYIRCRLRGIIGKDMLARVRAL